MRHASAIAAGAFGLLFGIPGTVLANCQAILKSFEQCVSACGTNGMCVAERCGVLGQQALPCMQGGRHTQPTPQPSPLAYRPSSRPSPPAANPGTQFPGQSVSGSRKIQQPKSNTGADCVVTQADPQPHRDAHGNPYYSYYVVLQNVCNAKMYAKACFEARCPGATLDPGEQESVLVGRGTAKSFQYTYDWSTY